MMAALSGIDILYFDNSAAVEYAVVKNELMRAGTPIEDIDILIGAHARALGYTLVTDNTRHLGKIPLLQLENWIER